MKETVVALAVGGGRWHSEAASVRFGCHSVACQLERSATRTPCRLRFNFLRTCKAESCGLQLENKLGSDQPFYHHKVQLYISR